MHSCSSQNLNLSTLTTRRLCATSRVPKRFTRSLPLARSIKFSNTIPEMTVKSKRWTRICCLAITCITRRTRSSSFKKQKVLLRCLKGRKLRPKTSSAKSLRLRTTPRTTTLLQLARRYRVVVRKVHRIERLSTTKRLWETITLPGTRHASRCLQLISFRQQGRGSPSRCWCKKQQTNTQRGKNSLNLWFTTMTRGHLSKKTTHMRSTSANKRAASQQPQTMMTHHAFR